MMTPLLWHYTFCQLVAWQYVAGNPWLYCYDVAA